MTTIEEHRVGDVTVLALRGRLVLEGGDDELRRKIDELIAQGRTKVLIDMSGVDYVDSAGIGVLIAKYLSLRRKAGDLKFLRLNTRTEHVMQIAHLLSVFEIFDSQDAAVGSFSRK